MTRANCHSYYRSGMVSGDRMSVDSGSRESVAAAGCGSSAVVTRGIAVDVIFDSSDGDVKVYAASSTRLPALQQTRGSVR
jgi:hypothetical protein